MATGAIETGQTVAVIGTGDMGSAIGRALRDAGHRVVTSLAGRSAASRQLARGAGLEDLGSLERVLAECDILLAVLPPAAALEFAREAAAIIAVGGRELVYADCNAVAPTTLADIEALFADGPACFVDAGIVGPPPRQAGTTRCYVSGARRDALLSLAMPVLEMIDMGSAAGRASAIKMCYAAMNKGVDALYTNLLLASRALGVEQELLAELDLSQAEAFRRMVRRIPFLAAAAGRYVGEMYEIAAGFDAAGVSGDFYRGAAWLYALLAESSLAEETRASLPAERSLEEAMAAFAAALAARY